VAAHCTAHDVFAHVTSTDSTFSSAVRQYISLTSCPWAKPLSPPGACARSRCSDAAILPTSPSAAASSVRYTCGADVAHSHGATATSVGRQLRAV
jgi:hypothetical protein